MKKNIRKYPNKRNYIVLVFILKVGIPPPENQYFLTFQIPFFQTLKIIDFQLVNSHFFEKGFPKIFSMHIWPIALYSKIHKTLVDVSIILILLGEILII